MLCSQFVFIVGFTSVLMRIMIRDIHSQFADFRGLDGC